MKRLVLILIIAAAIVLIAIYFKPSPIIEASNLTISNFAFAEAATGPTACDVKVENKIIFSGPLTKPTPCNGLAADYTTTPNSITINITTTPFEGFCAQVMTDSFYTGSFEISPAKDFTLQIYYGGEQICRQVLTLS